MLRGIFLKRREVKKKPKDIYATFSPRFTSPNNIRSKIIRRFRGFVLRGSIDQEDKKSILSYDTTSKGTKPQSSTEINNIIRVKKHYDEFVVTPKKLSENSGTGSGPKMPYFTTATNITPDKPMPRSDSYKKRILKMNQDAIKDLDFYGVKIDDSKVQSNNHSKVY